MIGSILGLISSIGGILAGNSANNATMRELDALQKKQVLPPALLSAENILREQSTSGMPGYDTQKAEIGSNMATTINQMKDYVSGGGLIESIAKANTQANDQYRKLYDANEAAKQENKLRLASFLGGTKANAEQSLQDNLNSIATTKMGIRQARTQDVLNFANMGLGAIGNDRGLQMAIGKILEGGGGGVDLPGALDWTNDVYSPFGKTVIPGSNQYMTESFYAPRNTMTNDQALESIKNLKLLKLL